MDFGKYLYAFPRMCKIQLQLVEMKVGFYSEVRDNSY